jgi:environmental stress-induced protein Ves
MITLLPPSRYRRTPWKNGGGTTTTIAEKEGVWQFGRTPITTPGPFSDYTGYERLQVLVSGRGLVLQTPNGEIDVRTSFRPVRFEGESRVVSRLEAGPVEVVNLIGRRSNVAIELIVLQASQSHGIGKGTHFAYAPIGAATVNGQDVPADHCLHMDSEPPTLLTCGLGTVIVGSVTCV